FLCTLEGGWESKTHFLPPLGSGWKRVEPCSLIGLTIVLVQKWCPLRARWRPPLLLLFDKAHWCLIKHSGGLQMAGDLLTIWREPTVRRQQACPTCLALCRRRREGDVRRFFSRRRLLRAGFYLSRWPPALPWPVHRLQPHRDRPDISAPDNCARRSGLSA